MSSGSIRTDAEVPARKTAEMIKLQAFSVIGRRARSLLFWNGLTSSYWT